MELINYFVTKEEKELMEEEETFEEMVLGKLDIQIAKSNRP